MIINDVIQGTDEWKAVRLGIPTASEFDKIITGTGKASTQYDAYANRLLAEIMVGNPVDTFDGTAWTERGNELEPEAVHFYELTEDVEAIKVGFCTDDLRTMGASPDRLIGEEGLLEIKCPAPHTHVAYMLERKLDQKYYPQLQGQLLVTGRKWVDILSYHPEMPPVIIRVGRDEAYLSAMTRLLWAFTKAIDEKKQLLIEKGLLKCQEA